MIEKRIFVVRGRQVMLSGVLRSDRAIAVNIEIMRAFVELRRVASSYAALEERLEQVERGMGEHDEQLEQIFEL